MEWNFESAIIGGTFGAACGYAISTLSGIRDRVTDFIVSQNGLHVHTNSSEISFEIGGKLERIDSGAQKSIRKGTTGHMLLDPIKYGTAPDVMMVNHKAVLSLIYAVYENHHTRELADNGAEVYITDKVNEIVELTRIWRNVLPNILFDDLIEGYICYWIKNILIPPLQKACDEKIDFYKELLARKNVSETLKEQIKAWITKNDVYVKRIEELSEHSGIKERSTIYKLPKKENEK